MSFTGAISSLSKKTAFFTTNEALHFGQVLMLELFDTRVEAEVVFVSPLSPRGVVLSFEPPPHLQLRIENALEADRAEQPIETAIAADGGLLVDAVPLRELEREAVIPGDGDTEGDLLGSETLPINTTVLTVPIHEPEAEDDEESTLSTGTIQVPNRFPPAFAAQAQPRESVPPSQASVLGSAGLRSDTPEPEAEPATHRADLVQLNPGMELFDASTMPSSDLAAQALDFGPAVDMPTPRRASPPKPRLVSLAGPSIPAPKPMPITAPPKPRVDDLFWSDAVEVTRPEAEKPPRFPPQRGESRSKLEPPNSEPMKADGPKHELPRAELPKNELPKNELPKNELSKNELPKNELSKNELPKNEPPKNELSKNELPKNELSKNELSKNELSKNELSKNELPKNELPKNELPRAELPKNELPKVELPKLEPPRRDTSKAPDAKAGSAEPIKSVIVKPESVKPDAKSEPAKPASGGEPAPVDTSLPVLAPDGVTLRFASRAQYNFQHKANIQHGGIIAKASPLPIGSQKFIGVEVPGCQRYTVSLRVTFIGDGTVGFTIDSFPVHRNQLRAFLEA